MIFRAAISLIVVGRALGYAASLRFIAAPKLHAVHVNLLSAGLIKQTLVGFLILIWPHLLNVSVPSELIVWNVGQGLWVTAHTPNECTHFDMGGEHLPLDFVARLCRTKSNRVYFSHWDKDHIQFFSAVSRSFPNICIAKKPKGHPPLSIGNRKIMTWRQCDQDDPKIQILQENKSETGTRLRHNSSFVYIYDRKWLLPGDSPTAEENHWVQNIEAPKTISGWVLGHHGSSTSSGHKLLSQLTQVQVAIASARSARYGHPDAQLRIRLRTAGLLPVRTEDFGHLRFRSY